jgi:hypothetical protein
MRNKVAKKINKLLPDKDVFQRTPLPKGRNKDRFKKKLWNLLTHSQKGAIRAYVGLLILLLSFGVFSFKADSTGIPILIIEKRFDNMWSDTVRDTCICFHCMDGKNYKVIKKDSETVYPMNQYLIKEDN